MASASMTDNATVTIGDLTRTGATAIGHVIKANIDEPPNSEAAIVEVMSVGSVIAAGRNKGDGSDDACTDLLMPNRQGIWDQYVVGAQSVGHNQPCLGSQMMYVPSHMADRVSAVDDLKGPESAAVFDKDGNGKGEHWAGDAGWKSTRMWQLNRLLQPLRQWAAPARSSSCSRRMPETGNLTRCPPA